jgi:hypothetical protein
VLRVCRREYRSYKSTPHHSWSTPHHSWSTPYHSWSTPHHSWSTPHPYASTPHHTTQMRRSLPRAALPSTARMRRVRVCTRPRHLPTASASRCLQDTITVTCNARFHHSERDVYTTTRVHLRETTQHNLKYTSFCCSFVRLLQARPHQHANPTRPQHASWLSEQRRAQQSMNTSKDACVRA